MNNTIVQNNRQNQAEKEQKGQNTDFTPIQEIVDACRERVEQGELDIKQAAKELIRNLLDFVAEDEEYKEEIVNTKIKNTRLEEE